MTRKSGDLPKGSPSPHAGRARGYGFVRRGDVCGGVVFKSPP
jgi:hypothetical protein